MLSYVSLYSLFYKHKINRPEYAERYLCKECKEIPNGNVLMFTGGITLEYFMDFGTSFSKLKIMRTAITYSTKKCDVLVDQCIVSLGTNPDNREH